MLRKLFKYEWKSTARFFLPLLGVLVAFTFLNKILYSNVVSSFLLRGQSAWISTIFFIVAGMIYGILLGAAFMATVLVLIRRFYKNLLGDEGYLMMTLPVKPWAHIVSKLLISGVWNIINITVAVLSILFMALDGPDWVSMWGDLGDVLMEAARELRLPPILVLLELALIPLVCAFGGMLPIFACISLGQRWRKHKIIGAIVWYVAANTVLQILFVALMHLFDESIYYMVDGRALYHIVVWGIILFNLVWYGISFVVTNYCLSKRLNLE